MKLSIVLVNYNSWKDLLEHLAVLFGDKKDFSGENWQVIVVDNGSDEGPEKADFLNHWVEAKRVTFLPVGENVGFGAGNNRGIAESLKQGDAEAGQGQYFLVVNPDVRVKAGEIEKALEYMDAHETVGILGIRLLYPDGIIQDSYRNFPRIFDQVIKRVPFLLQRKFLRGRVSKYLLWHKDPKVTEPVDWIVGAFMLIRRKAWERVGGFDESFFLFMEDVDLCRRMWCGGWQVVYFAESEALHKKERLSEGSVLDVFKSRLLRIHVKSAVKYFLKYLAKPLPR